MIIDFHTHTFPASISLRAMENLSRTGHVRYFADPTAQNLAASMKETGIDRSVNLPVMTRPDQVVSVHDGLLRRQEELRGLGILTFGGLHPDFEKYREEIRRLKEHGVPGIKLHPAFWEIPVQDIRIKRIIDAVSEAGLITLLHAGWDVSFLHCDYASVSGILEVIRDVRPEKLVLAHMGGWQEWEQVESDLAGAPVWLDTSYSLGPVPRKEGEEAQMPYTENLSPEAFVRLARRHGTDRILFGTDFPWTSTREYVDGLEGCPLTREEKDRVFGENAKELLGAAC